MSFNFEKFAAIKVALDILDLEDFTLCVREITNFDIEQGEATTEELGQNCFCLSDNQGANLGGIESEIFFNLGLIVDRLDTYHNDYFFEPYCDREDVEDIPSNDWDRMIIALLDNKYFAELLFNISVDDFLEFQQLTESKFLNEISKPVKSTYYHPSNYSLGKDIFNYEEYLLDKSIALTIIETESAYQMFEYKNKIYLSYYASFDTENGFNEFRNAVLSDLQKNADMSHYCMIFDTYKQIIDREYGQIVEDIQDIGLLDKNNNWDFYLTQNELEYLNVLYKENL